MKIRPGYVSEMLPGAKLRVVSVLAVVTCGVIGGGNAASASAAPSVTHPSNFTWSTTITRPANNSWILDSPDKTHRAIFQNDSNFVVYNGSKPIWSSQTSAPGSGGVLQFASDGNVLVIENGQGPCSPTSVCIAPWENGVQGFAPPFHLTMQNDGNLVEYLADGDAIWATHTDGK